MTFDDMQTIEIHVAELTPMGVPRPPVMLILAHGRVEVDLAEWDDIGQRLDLLDGLRRSFQQIGHPEWQAWITPRASAVCISEREAS